MKNPKILPAARPANIAKAAALLKRGGIVAFPTETVYGLGADAFNPRAVARVFEAKKRPFFDPLIVHVASVRQAEDLWKEVPVAARLLMKHFWPGPLTLVLPKSKKIPAIVTAGLDTVAVRMPAHPAALHLIRSLGRPIAAPSANPFGRTSPTRALSVSEDLAGRVDLILDGGPAKVGVESTVIQIEKGRCVLLRPGGVTMEEIKKFVPIKSRAKKISKKLASPGLLEIHYAPRTPLVLMKKPYKKFMRELMIIRKKYRREKIRWPRLGVLAFRGGLKTSAVFRQEATSASGNLREAATNLFQAMRKLDKMKLDLIIAESVPEGGIGLAVMDRLKKAAGGRQIERIEDCFKNIAR